MPSEESAENFQETAIRKLPVTSLMPKDIMLHHEYVADIQAIQNVEIRARVKGYLEKIYVDEGQRVKKGQPLFSINDEEYKSRLAKTKANLETAIAEAKAKELEVDRVKLLSDKKVISSTELEVAKAQLNAAHARIDEARSAFSNAQIELSYTYMKAPFDGIVDRIPLKVGSFISEGTLLTTVSDNSSFHTYFNMSEKEYLQYMKTRLGNDEIDHDEVELILADGSKYPYIGKIQTMEGEFEEGTGSIAFRAHFPNPDKIVKHNASGKIRLTNLVEDALFIPQKSVFSIQDKNFVYVVGEDNKVKMKSFDLKTRFSYFYLIDGGLEAGEYIVYEGVQNIRDGITIEPLKVHMDSLVTRAPDLGATFY
ncbi:MAG: efflux RND transporter periplasmic adaptor subunit [Cyclobacteriaceae bacterium]